MINFDWSDFFNGKSMATCLSCESDHFDRTVLSEILVGHMNTHIPLTTYPVPVRDFGRAFFLKYWISKTSCRNFILKPVVDYGHLRPSSPYLVSSHWFIIGKEHPSHVTHMTCHTDPTPVRDSISNRMVINFYKQKNKRFWLAFKKTVSDQFCTCWKHRCVAVACQDCSFVVCACLFVVWALFSEAFTRV